MDCAKKISSNLSQLFLVQENLAFLFSRFLVFGGCKTKKKHVDRNYISLVVFFFHEIYGISPFFLCQVVPSPRFGWVFFLGGRSHTKNQHQRKVTGIPKSFSWSPWAKNSSKQTKAQALVSPTMGDIHMYAYVYLKTYMIYVYIYLSIYIYIHVYSMAY